jgi:hypothetical protein
MVEFRIWKDKIGKGGILVGETCEDGFVYRRHSEYYPMGLFLLGRDRMPYAWFVEWMKDRVFEPLRPDRDILLKSIGLKEYNIVDIIEKTEGITLDDDYRIEVIR